MRAILFGLLILVSGFLSPTARAADPPAPNVTPIIAPEKQGAEIASRLRNAMPAERSEFRGDLTITTRDDRITTVPILSATVIDPAWSNGWVMSYVAYTASKTILEEVVVERTAGKSNAYRVYLQTNSVVVPTNKLPSPGSSSHQVWNPSPSELTRPFAGSDFWLCDLGLEFLHWPRQRVLKHEMRSSRSCWVLESITPSPAPGGYARVVSWVDVEYEGILHADAYEKPGDKKPLKQFKVGAFHKVDGRYQLESMRMSNLRTGRESEIKFDLPK